MKILKKISLLLLLGSFAVNASGEVLAKFDLNNFEGWTYTRDVELTTTYIGNNKVTLFKTSGGKDYTLISPPMACQGIKKVRAKFTYILPTVGQDKFSLTKASPTVELLDMNNQVVAQQYVLLKKAVISQDVAVALDVPENASSLRLRLAAWSGDMNSPGAVREVVVKPLILGDVDDDGVVGVTDVTWLINMCLDIIPGDITLGDMNGDGELTVIDVTLLISKILSN